MASGWGAALGVAALATATPAAACGTEPYLGAVCTFAADWCPPEYLPANGQLLSIREYAALFATIGNRYGGNGANDFAVPDFRGRMAVGKGQATGFSVVQLAEKVGQQAVQLMPGQVPLVPHSHTATFAGTGEVSRHVSIPASPGSLGVTSKLEALQVTGTAQPLAGKFLGMGGGGNQQAPIYATSSATTTAVALGGLEVNLTGTPGHSAFEFEVKTGITGGNVSVAPAGSPATANVSTQSPGLGVTVCIATSGLYPPRP